MHFDSNYKTALSSRVRHTGYITSISQRINAVKTNQGYYILTATSDELNDIREIRASINKDDRKTIDAAARLMKERYNLDLFKIEAYGEASKVPKTLYSKIVDYQDDYAMKSFKTIEQDDGNGNLVKRTKIIGQYPFKVYAIYSTGKPRLYMSDGNPACYDPSTSWNSILERLNNPEFILIIRYDEILENSILQVS